MVEINPAAGTITIRDHQKRNLTAVPKFTVRGECKVIVGDDDAELYLWQVRRLILEHLFFEVDR